MTAVRAGRNGYVIDGTIHRRTTSITNCTPKPWLGAWAAKMVAEKVADDPQFVADLVARGKTDAIKYLKGIPWSKRDAAADRGTLIHSLVEAHIEGRPLPDFNDDEMAVALAFEQFVSDWRPQFEQTETTCHDPNLRVAGTFDAVAVMEGQRWLLDWKSSAAVYAEFGPQLCFYARAPMWCEADDKGRWVRSYHAPVVDRAAVVHLTPTGYSLVEMDTGDSQWALFRALVKVAEWVDEHKDWKAEGLLPPAANVLKENDAA